jgi:hypothetical protein
MKPYTLYPSTIKTKRYMIYVPKNDKLKVVHFGSPLYENYPIHKDLRRKELYEERHKNDKLTDPYSPGFWAMYVLWNKPNLQESFTDAVKRAKRILNH